MGSKELESYNLLKSACPVPTYLAWRCSSWELILNLSLACIVTRQQAYQSSVFSQKFFDEIQS